MKPRSGERQEYATGTMELATDSRRVWAVGETPAECFPLHIEASLEVLKQWCDEALKVGEGEDEAVVEWDQRYLTFRLWNGTARYRLQVLNLRDGWAGFERLTLEGWEPGAEL